MADQEANPLPWQDWMSDGCTGVVDKLPLSGDCRPCCVAHDRAYYYGGTKKDRLKADLALRECMIRLGGAWLILAQVRFWGVRLFGVRHFNWLGPGLDG